MRVTLLGTGAADGIPQAFCRCATCEEARRHGPIRQPGGVLIDGTLLIDPGPGLAGAAARAGVHLAEVTTIAVTHAHPDHWDPSVLLHRAWEQGRRTDARARPSRSLTIIGPAMVLAEARRWLGPDPEVELVEATAGRSWQCAELTISALESSHGSGSRDEAAAQGVLYAIAGARTSMLYACDTGPLPMSTLDALTDADFDLALVELTFGNRGPTTEGHLDHSSFPAALAALRRVGALSRGSDVIATHIGHHNPPDSELSCLLSDWGARSVPDGTTVNAGEPLASGPPLLPTRRVLVTGGARSGKSAWAEAQASEVSRRTGGSVVYVATGWPSGDDASWSRRVEQHRQRRPAHWSTVETVDVCDALAQAHPDQVLIVDCLGTWLTRLIDDACCWGDRQRAEELVEMHARRLAAALHATDAQFVAVVTNEVGSGVVPASASGGLFRDLLGRLNALISAACDEAVLMVAGRVLPLGAQITGVAPPQPTRITGADVTTSASAHDLDRQGDVAGVRP